jgi:hypothetical protein
MIAALAFAGCGSDDGDSGGDSGDAATAAFVKDAEQICADSALQLKVQLTREFGQREISRQELVAFTRSTAIPNIEHQLERVRALTQPDADRSTLQRYYSAYEEGIEQLKQNPSLVNESEVPPAFVEANRLARQYGIDGCVR